ncbi:MAG: serine/threonine-protein kinase, partial [Defluviicoccus sp.]
MAMADAATSLKAFLDGQLSLDVLLAQLERLIVEADGGDRALLDVIRNSPWRERLDADVTLAIEQRILAAAAVVRVNSASKGAAASRSAPPSAKPQDVTDQTHLVAKEPMTFRIGSTIKGRFELIEELGEGGMSKVFKAFDRVRAEALDRQPYVAIKVLSQVLRQSPHSVMALQREAKKALSLAHPNIVRVYDFDRAGPNFYMTMEYLRGRSLDKVIRAPGFAGLPLERVLALIEPVAAALSHAHQTGIVHADLKPSNIFLTDDDQVKVIDFGIARAVEEPGADGERTVFDPSALGALTPRYASPEQCAGVAADQRDDVYALACVIYELLTGKHPFDGLSGLQAHLRHVQPARPPALEPRRWDALKRGLAFERAART